GRGACAPHPAFRGGDLSKAMFGLNCTLHPAVPTRIERRQPKAPDAKSLATSRHDRRIASPRRGVRLVLDQGQRNLRLGPAFFRSGLPAQDRRNQSATSNEKEGLAQKSMERSLRFGRKA